MNNKNGDTAVTYDDLLREITRRKRTEEALKAAIAKAEDEKNKSNAILEAMGDNVIIQDTDYKIIYQNQVNRDSFGNRIGEYCYKVYEGRDAICEGCPLELSFRDGKIHRAIRSVSTERGTQNIEYTTSPLRDSSGKIIAGIKIVRDVTERKRAEEELREGEQFLASIFASIQDGIGIIDKDMNILRVNQTAEKWYPHAVPFVGKKCYAAYHGRTKPCEVCPALKTLKTGESAYEVVPKHGTGGNEVGWLEIYSYPMMDTKTGQMKGVIEYVRDITEHKRAEEAIQHRIEMEKLLAGISTGFINLSLDEIDRGINQALQSIGEFADVDRSYVFQFYDNGTKMENTHEWCSGGIEPQIQNLKGLLLNDFPWFAERINKHEIVHVSRVIDLPPEASAEKKTFQMQSIKSLILVPMMYGGNLIGFLGFDSVREEKTWMKEDTRLLKMVGDIFANALERKRAEKKLKLFSEAVENAPDGVQITNMEGHIIYSNKAVEEIYGFSREEFKGKHVNEMNEDPEFASKVILPAIKNSGRWIGELMVKHKNGKVFPIWLTASMVKDAKGRPIAMMGIIKDITERKRIEQVLLESEERYRSLFENSPISLWEEDSSDLKKYVDNLRSKGIKNLRAYFDKHPKEVELCTSLLKVIDVNKATINLFNAKGKGDLINGLGKIFTERSYETFKEELIAIAGGKTSFESEDIVKTLTGDKIHISLRWVLTPGNEETYSKRLVSIINITERKRAEDEIRRYAMELEESNRMKELFTDIMHHDLLNPLSIAKGYAELLHEAKTDSRRLAYIEAIERNLDKGITLIDCTTMLSKLESMESIGFEHLDIKEIIEGVIENLVPMASEAGMKIENNIVGSMPAQANKIIEEVFSNLLSNAVKYASGGKRIQIEGEDMGDSWRVRVTDFGEGIDDAYKTVIFERFRMMEKKGVKGSGLGLAIAGKIVELHKGRIWVEDNPEGGAVFNVEIPKS